MKAHANKDLALTRSNKVDEHMLIELLDQYKEQFYRIAFSYVRNEQDALDIIQESVYKAYISLDKLQSKDYFKTWFTRILINQSIDQLKANKKVIHLFSSEDSQMDIPDTSSKDFSALEMSIDMAEILNQLDSNERMILTLRFYQDYSLKDISDLIDKPLSTVKSTLYRGLEKLKSLYAKGDHHE